MNPRRRGRYLLDACSALVLTIVLCAVGGCALTVPPEGLVRFSLDQPGLGVEGVTTLLTALPLVNSGTITADHVEVQSISLQSATLVSPTTFPLALGTVVVRGRAVVQSAFASTHWIADQPYVLEVTGRYVVGENTLGFSVQRHIILPPRAPGSAPMRTAEALPNSAHGAPYPHRDIAIPDEVNAPGPPVPTGTVRGDMMPATTPTSIQPSHAFVGSRGSGIGAARALASPGAPADDLVFVKNTSFRTGGFSGIPNDPSGASGAFPYNGPQTVVATGNTYASFSTDGGSTFAQLDPTTIFPNNVDGGLCCDQVVHYSHNVNRYFWLMLFRVGANNQNRLRLAAASPADLIASGGTAWTYWDLTSAVFNLGNNSMDYPDLSVGDNYLYVSVDAFGSPSGLMVARIPLTELRDGGTIQIGYTNPSDGASAFGVHLIQSPGDEIFWAGHPSTSLLRIFSLKEGSNTYYWRDVAINSYPFGDFTSTSPDGTNWLASVFSGGPGGTRVGADIWFEWMGGRGGGFPQPHIQLVHIRRSDFSVIEQTQIWNASLAFNYASLTTNDLGLVGVSLAYGGGGFYGSPAVMILGQGVFYPVCTSSANAGRYGDYSTVREAFPNSSLFSAEGYCVSATGNFDPHYILFGRSSDVNPPPIG